ncbi:MAG: LysR substrate-binding domain-containing protein [Desulfobacterales bacterium]|nr:LysR substrate-binding domain-containing protein [Desulfobacterales bacterium]
MNQITIPQVRILDAVAREENFSRAAALLGISQPAVSVQLRDLQRRYGVKIYHRQGKKIRLSPLGKDLLKTGRKVLGLLHEMDTRLRESRDLLSGRLHIGLSCHYFVRGLLARFMETYPGIRVRADIGHSTQLLDQVLACRMDLAEVTAREPDPRLHHLKYSEQQILLFVSRDHAWASRKTLPVKALHGQKMVALHTRSMTRQIFDQALEKRGVKPNIVLELDNWATMRELVSANIGFGIALEDEFGPRETLVREHLKKIRLRGKDFTAGQYFVCQPEYRDLTLVKAFLDIAEQERDRHKIQKILKQGDPTHEV